MHYVAYYGQVLDCEDKPPVVPTVKKLENLTNEIHRIIK